MQCLPTRGEAGFHQSRSEKRRRNTTVKAIFRKARQSIGRICCVSRRCRLAKQERRRKCVSGRSYLGSFGDVSRRISEGDTTAIAPSNKGQVTRFSGFVEDHGFEHAMISPCAIGVEARRLKSPSVFQPAPAWRVSSSSRCISNSPVPASPMSQKPRLARSG